MNTKIYSEMRKIFRKEPVAHLAKKARHNLFAIMWLDRMGRIGTSRILLSIGSPSGIFHEY